MTALENLLLGAKHKKGLLRSG